MGMKGKVKIKIGRLFRRSASVSNEGFQATEAYPLKFVQADAGRSWYVGAYQAEYVSSKQ